MTASTLSRCSWSFWTKCAPSVSWRSPALTRRAREGSWSISESRRLRVSGGAVYEGRVARRVEPGEFSYPMEIECGYR